MKGKPGETRRGVHFFTRRGDVIMKKTKFPTKQADRNLKRALCRIVRKFWLIFYRAIRHADKNRGGKRPRAPLGLMHNGLIFILTPLQCMHYR